MPDYRKKWYISQLFPPFNQSERRSRIQLNPRTAILQNESKSRIRQLTAVGTVVAILLLFYAVSSLKQRPVDIQASFDFKRAISGTVISVDPLRDTFTLNYVSSADSAVSASQKKTWTVHLIPGRSVSRSKAQDKACFLIPNFESSLLTAVASDCHDVITAGRRVQMDYVFLNIPKSDVVVRSIIGE